jgi:hypothetical protein
MLTYSSFHVIQHYITVAQTVVLLISRVDLWHVTKNLQERLSKIDQTRLVAVDMVNTVTQHFERIRLAQALA